MFFVSIKKNTARNGKKLTIIAPKKLFKKAVERNKVKRRLRAVVSPAIKKMESNIIIIPNKKIKLASFIELKSEIIESLKSFQ